MPKKSQVKGILPYTLSLFTGLDRVLLLVVVALSVFGLVAVFNSSVVSAFRDFGNQYHFVRDQAKYLAVGLMAMVVISFVDYHVWYRFAIPLLVATLIFLVAVFIPGIGVHALGAKRWLNFGLFTFQPTELAKLALVAYLSAWFTFREKGRLLPFLVLLSVVLGLVILQPDLGTAVIIMTIAGILYFISGAPIWHFLLLVPIALIGVGAVAVVAPYRLARLTTFLNFNADPLGSSYHVRQILVALGSGGWWGVGLGKSRQKYAYLPEANTDSIFAIIAEEIGFLGGLVVIAAFVIITLRALRIAKFAPDKFGQLLGSGVAIWFTTQSLINLSAMVVLIPLTGVPLPLISYGGSNLVSILVGMGILLNISRHLKVGVKKR